MKVGKLWIIACLGLFMFLPLVRANTFVNETINTTGNLSYYSNLYGDNVDVTIDGLNWQNELSSIHYDLAHSFNSESLVEVFRNIKDYALKGDTTWLTEKDYKIGYYLQSWLVPRTEYEQEINHLQFEISALQNSVELISEDAYCKGMQKAMIEYGLKNVTCPNNATYYNLYGESVSFK